MPYSWDDVNDFDAGTKQGFSFQDARKSYDDVAVARAASQAYFTYRNDFLTTDALYPIVVGIDTTGSMEEWPRVFFEKLPLLYKQAVVYFPECELSFRPSTTTRQTGPTSPSSPARLARVPS